MNLETPTRAVARSSTHRCTGDADAPTSARADRSPVDNVLFVTSSYCARYPSETLWQRLSVLAKLGPVHILPTLATPRNVIAPPAGATVVEPSNRTPAPLSALGFASRVRAYAAGLQRQGGRGLIWATPEYFSRRAANAAAKATGWPLVLDVWDVPDLSARNHIRLRHYHKALVHGLMQHRLAAHLERADLVVWGLHTGSVGQYFRPNTDRLLHLPNGVRWSALQDAHLRHGSGQDERLTGPLRLLYMGYYFENRGSKLLSEIVGLLSGRLDVRLHVVGDISEGPARKAVKEVPLPLRPMMHFHGHLPWISAMEALSRSDICLYPFPKYPELDFIYPLKLLEYAAMEKWIISSDLLGARELLEDYPKVIFCDPNSPQAWADAICSVAEAPPATAGFEGNSHPLAKYDWDNLNRTLHERVNNMLDRRAKYSVT
ncbi:MAG: glycosyltransferase family 4 protein [bacterium]|nr:glycosyltransferase family 4 protein [bacterium]